MPAKLISFPDQPTRRLFLKTTAAGLLMCTSAGAFADELARTPVQTEGPFYPDKLPLDTDNDLVVLNNDLTPAVGDVTYLSGKILDAKGDPIRGATVEIWQVDNNGNYLHSKGLNPNGKGRDSNFQGFGRFLTGSTGEYLFRTIKPVPYPGRTPHIHMAVYVPKQPKFTTQCYIKGHPQNETDGVLKGVPNKKDRDLLIIPFAPIAGSKVGELAAKFNVVLGYTPESK